MTDAAAQRRLMLFAIAAAAEAGGRISDKVSGADCPPCLMPGYLMHVHHVQMCNGWVAACLLVLLQLVRTLCVDILEAAGQRAFCHSYECQRLCPVSPVFFRWSCNIQHKPLRTLQVGLQPAQDTTTTMQDTVNCLMHRCPNRLQFWPAQQDRENTEALEALKYKHCAYLGTAGTDTGLA